MVMKGAQRGPMSVDLVLNQQLPDDLVVFKVINRLPIANVFQCKCVSKSWCSIIQKPEFSEAYRDCNPCCLVVSVPFFKRNYFKRLYYSPLQASGRWTKLFPLHKDEKLRLLHKREGGTIPKATRVINGLFCHWSDRYVFICNVFSGEIMRLPDPPPTSFCRSLNYYFGYDPVNRVYKLLLKRNAICYQQLHILTLGNNSSWKELKEGEAYFRLENQSICINGVLYWIESFAMDTIRYCLHFLNLSNSEENIGYCSIPTYIRNNVKGFHYGLVQFRGQLCLLSCSLRKVIFHTLQECVGNQGKWSRHVLFLPSKFHEDGSIVWMDSLSTGEVLLGTTRCVVYSYHYENGRALSRHVFKGLYENVDHIVFCGKPNIATLDTLINSGRV